MKLLAEHKDNKDEGGPAQASAVVAAPAAPEVVDDFDFNIDGADQEVVAVAAKAELEKLAAAESEGSSNVYESLYVLLLQVVETFMSLSPQSVTTVKFDMLRLLDDFIPWESSASCAQVQNAVQELNSEVLLAILKLLRQATTSVECRWFGTQDDAVKMLINLIVSDDWRQTLKRSVLMKLMVLAAPSGSNSYAEEISRRARSLLKTVLIQSGLFVGHGLLDLELTSELHAWMGNLSAADDSILATESLVRISHHWNTEVGIMSAQSLTKIVATARHYTSVIGLEADDSDADFALMPFSPIFFSSMLLLSGNFQVFASLLPKHIRTHIQSTSTGETDASAPSPSSTFFDKYNAQFRGVTEALFSSVFCKVLGQVRAPTAFCASVHAALTCSRANLPNLAGKTTAGIATLLEVMECTTAVAAKSAANGNKTPKKETAPVVADVLERLKATAASTPEIYDDLLSLLDGNQKSAEDKKVKGSAKKTGKPIMFDGESAFSKAISRVDLFPSLLAALLVHSSALPELASSSPAVSAFIANNWRVLLSILLGASNRTFELDGKYFAWARDAWETQLSQADGLHAKALMLHDVLHNLQLLSTQVGDKCYQFSAEGELEVNASSAQDANEGTAAPRSARKRTQSDLSCESQAVISTSALPFGQALVRTALEILRSPVGASPTVAVILSSNAVVDSLVTAGWYGQWVRRVFRTVCAADRARRQTVSKKRTTSAANHTSGSEGTLNALWKRIGEKILVSDNAEVSQDLQVLAAAITQLVDLPALRKLVVDSSVSEQIHAVLGQMLLNPAEATHGGASLLSTVEEIIEEVLRTAPLTQIVSSVEDLMSRPIGEAEQNSALCSTIYRDESAATINGDTGAYYFDPLSLMESVKVPSSTQQASSLFLRNSFLRPTEQPLVKKSKLTAEQVLMALRFETVLPAELVRGDATVTAAADLLVKKWDNLPVSAQVAPQSVLVEVTQLLELSSADAEVPSSPLRTQLLSLVSSAAAECSASHVFVQYVSYLAQMPAASWSTLVPLIVADRLWGASQLSSASAAEPWVRAFTATVVSSIDACLTTLSELGSSQGISNNAKSVVFETLVIQLADVEYLLTTRFSSGLQHAELLQESSAVLKKKFNKLSKGVLKTGMESAAVLNFVAMFQRLLHASADNVGGATLLGAILQPSTDDFYHPDAQMSLIPGHSKFTAILSIGKDTHHPAKLPLLRLLLQLALIVYKDRNAPKKKRKEKIDSIAQYFLADALVSVYGGTLSEADRVCSRILTVLSEANRCPALCTLQPRAPVGSVLRATGARSAEEMLVDSARWLVEGISPVMTYSTLARYPLWRSLAAQPLHHIESAFTSSSKKAVDKASVEREWKGGDETDMEVDDDGDRVSDAADGDADEDTMVTPKFDALINCSDKVLDPAFYIPAMFFVLRNREVSIRQMANSGALSLLIAVLGSSCPALRSCALACLQYVLNMLHQQNPTRDAAFRERAQLVLLLNYVRNSFDPSERVVPHLPLTTAIFLGRAAMNVMQPNHELFGRVNKYLLNRPFCDPKDVPLYDLLLVNGDAQSDQMQRLSALRLFRDGLFTKQDHLNLCRKNAYNRLMLLFPLLAKDTRAGHAVLDLLDRGLCMKVSARYLLERCRISAWVKLLAAPMSAMHLPATVGAPGQTGQGTNKISTHGAETGGLAHYSKYLVRALTLLRRVIAAGYLLACEDEKTKTHLQDVRMICIAVANEAITAVDSGYGDGIPAEFFTQIVLCMWDLSLVLQKITPSAAAPVLWSASLIRGLFHAIQAKLTKAHVQSRTPINQDELSMSLLMLVRFSAVAEVCDDLFAHMRRLSNQLLLPPPQTAHASPVEKGAMAIVASTPLSGSSKRKLIAPDVPLHQLLDNPSQLSHYANTVHYLAAVMGSNSLGIDDFDIQSHFEFSWTVLAGTDLINTTALPTSLGKQFVLTFVAEMFAARKGVVDGLAYARWALLMWKSHTNPAWQDTVAAHARTATSDSAILSRERVAEAILPTGHLCATAALCLVAARGLRKNSAVATSDAATDSQLINALEDVVSSLSGVITSPPPTEVPDQLKVESVVAHAFDFMSAVVTLADHPSSRDGSIGPSFKMLLQNRASIVSMLCTPTATSSVVGEECVRAQEDDSQAAQRVAMSAFLDEALQVVAASSTSKSYLQLGVGATYMPLQYSRQVAAARTSRGTQSTKVTKGDRDGEGDADVEDVEEVEELLEEDTAERFGDGEDDAEMGSDQDREEGSDEEDDGQSSGEGEGSEWGGNDNDSDADGDMDEM